jgi:TonB-dependent Receptor Plug Domain/CarboxypepD_reg-like domain
VKKVFVFIFLVASFYAHGQNILDSKLDGSEEGQSLTDFLHSFEKKQKARFFFLNEWFEQTKIENSFKDKTLREALEATLRGTDISFVEFYDYAVIFSKDPSRALERESIIRNARNEQKKIDNVILGNKANYQSGKIVQVTGSVVDGKSKEPLIGATIFITDINQAVSTGPEGKYSVSIPSGEHIISFKSQNYDEKLLSLRAYEGGVVNMDLLEAPRMLAEVEINADHLNVVSSKVGQTNIKMVDVKKMPAFLGEVDIIKSIQILPGVTSVGEVSSGFNVRGGGVDQNLILYDGLQVFNNSHVFGFFSSFNSEAIKDATFYKGGIPAEYGGRVSSVLSVTSKEGNYKKWEASGGIGLVSSNLAFGGPIKKDATSIMVSARSSYSDWMLKTLSTNYQGLRNSSVSFYDVSVKLTHKFSAKDKLAYSAYFSKDHFGLPTDTTFVWQNALNSLHLDHIFNDHAFSSITVGYGQYGYQVTDKDPLTSYQMKYKISYPSLRLDFNYQKGKHKVVAGLNSIYYTIQPGTIKPQSPESSVKPVTVDTNQSLENALFVSDDIDLNDRIHFDLGFRMSMFSSLGPATINQYQPGQPLSEETATGSTNYSSGKIIKNYFGPEPRASFRYTLTGNSSIKIGYNRIYQYIHLISSSTAVTPIDIWQPSNYYFKPQRGDQFSAGYFRNFKDSKYEFSMEGFYKDVKNILDFKDGASLVLNPKLETALLQGIAKSYGIEFSITKTTGRLMGSLNYTYARSLRKVDGPTPEERINNGNWYRSNYDQPNVVNLNWKYGLSRRFSFTGNFTYRTGRPVTVPYSYAVIDNIPIVNFSERNGYRVPDYHRLDLAIVMEGNHRRNKFWDGTWTLSLYNVYARKNVYSVFYKTNDFGLQTAYRMSIVGTVLPSLSYKFKI